VSIIDRESGNDQRTMKGDGPMKIKSTLKAGTGAHIVELG
jgi:hypothetical protein